MPGVLTEAFEPRASEDDAVLVLDPVPASGVVLGDASLVRVSFAVTSSSMKRP